jgi:hemerythrin-like domain-containing protein
MLDDITFLDDATRPEPPKLEGLTPAQKEAGRHLKEVHDHLRQNMAVLAGLIEEAAAGTVTPEEIDQRTSELEIVANYRRFGTLCGRHCQFVQMHHAIEDEAIFPVLASKGAVYRRIAERLQAEHVVVHELLVRLVNALNTLTREPGPETFAAAREVYDALGRVLLSHLGYEEDAIGDALGYFEVF